jgi:hypothetical protein
VTRYIVCRSLMTQKDVLLMSGVVAEVAERFSIDNSGYYGPFLTANEIKNGYNIHSI